MPARRQNPFKLHGFRGIDPVILSKLEKVGITTSLQMLNTGQTPEKRSALSLKSGVSEETILELVKLSDLARLPGVKGIRARLYYSAGVDTVEKLAAFEPDELLSLTSQFVPRTGFEGIAPLPKEVSSTIQTARKLPKIVIW